MSDKKTPYILKGKEGTQAYWACGKSNNMPYCDGALRGTGITPYIVKIEKEKTVAVCSCGHSGDMPFCDGTHASL